MFLDRMFVNLRQGRPRIYLASRLMDFYGRRFIGGPKPEDFPASIPLTMREHLAKTYFFMPVDRWIRKLSKHSELGQLWSTQLRQEEEPQAGKAAFIFPVVLCTFLVAAGGVIHSSSTGIESWWKQHQAKSAAKEAAEYRTKRADLQKKWTAEIAGFTAQQCLDEANDSRFRSTPEENDRYSVLEAGCADKSEQIQAIGAGWSIQQCADYANEGVAKAKKPGSQPVWVDADVFQLGCLKTHDQTALQALLTEN